MLRRNCVAALLSIVFVAGCVSSQVARPRGNTLGKFKGQTFAGIFVAGNGSREELAAAAMRLRAAVQLAGADFCDRCPEILTSYDLEPRQMREVRERIGLGEASSAKHLGATPKALWAIVTFDADGTVTYRVFPRLTRDQFREKVRIHGELRWGTGDPAYQTLMP